MAILVVVVIEVTAIFVVLVTAVAGVFAIFVTGIEYRNLSNCCCRSISYSISSISNTCCCGNRAGIEVAAVFVTGFVS